MRTSSWPSLSLIASRLGSRHLIATLLLVAFGFLGSGCSTKTQLRIGNRSVKTFSAAKKHIYKIFDGHRRTFYCGCSYLARRVDHVSCGYRTKKNAKRAERTEVEHVVPAHAFGQSFKAWRKGDVGCRDKGKRFRGRRCVRKVSSLFRLMEADLYNLQPVIGEVNADRSNFSMAMIDGETRAYGACDVEVFGRKIEPRPEIRGDIARTYFYMEWAYPGRGIISSRRRKLFEAWDREDPVSEWEHKRVQAIQRLQGNSNPFVGDVGTSATRPAN